MVESSEPMFGDSSQVPTELRHLFNKLKKYKQQSSVPNGILLPSLRAVQRGKLMKVVFQVNESCKYLHTSTLQDTIDLIFAAARVSVEELGMSCQSLSSGRPNSEPPWKIRLN